MVVNFLWMNFPIKPSSQQERNGWHNERLCDTIASQLKKAGSPVNCSFTIVLKFLDSEHEQLIHLLCWDRVLSIRSRESGIYSSLKDETASITLMMKIKLLELHNSSNIKLSLVVDFYFVQAFGKETVYIETLDFGHFALYRRY